MIERLIKETTNNEELAAFLSVYMTLETQDNQVAEHINYEYEEPEEVIVSSKKLEEMRKIQVHQIIKEGIEKHINELCIDTCQDLWKY